MTTLYRPVEIISAEQAEALPVGTVAYDPRVGAAVRVGYGLGWSVTGDPDSEQSGHMLGFTALVPIEAEEVRVVASGGLERDQHGATVINHTPDGPRRDYRRTEFHTPWEVAS